LFYGYLTCQEYSTMLGEQWDETNME
jgi:hypothetical protein